jgi:hypothetical protein
LWAIGLSSSELALQIALLQSLFASFKLPHFVPAIAIIPVYLLPIAATAAHITMTVAAIDGEVNSAVFTLAVGPAKVACRS